MEMGDNMEDKGSQIKKEPWSMNGGWSRKDGVCIEDKRIGMEDENEGWRMKVG